MQPFLERVVGHLERVQRVGSREIIEEHVAPDPARFEAFVVGLFEKAGGAGQWCWDPWYLHRFVEELHWDLLDGRGGQWTAVGRFNFIELVIIERSRLSDLFPQPGVATRLMAKAMAEVVEGRIGVHERKPPVWQAAPRYCEHLGLTHRTPAQARLAATGKTLLSLRGIDRLRWLLALETCVASSSIDPWCLDLASVRALAKQRAWWIDPRDLDPPPANDDAISRWTALGALRDGRTEDSYSAQAEIFDVTDVGAELFGELAAEGATSFRTLLRALLEDEREQVLAPLIGVDGSRDRATAATLRHARMVAHEVRNALLPVQHALEKVWGSPAVAATDLTEPRRRIDEGLARLYRFVDDSLRLTPIAAEEVAPFSVMEAIEEARRQCDPPPGGGVLVEARPGSANPRCRGHRGRFVLALLNLLRNAVQVGGPDVRVEIGVDARTSGRVIVSVRDDGPGISEAQQASIFQNGVSYRDGGTGHGLSFVRVVVEEEMGGVVRVLASAAPTGACFELEIPTEEEGR